MNKALMARYIWAVCQPSSSSIWVNWVKHYLIREHSFWELSTPSVCSWTWRKLLSLRDLIRPLIYHKIGNGMNTFLWFDTWLPSGPIVSCYGNIIIYDSGLLREARVSTIIQNGNWAWPVANSPDLLILKQSIPAALSPRCDHDDSICWRATSSGFSTSSA